MGKRIFSPISNNFLSIIFQEKKRTTYLRVTEGKHDEINRSGRRIRMSPGETVASFTDFDSQKISVLLSAVEIADMPAVLRKIELTGILGNGNGASIGPLRVLDEFFA